MATTKIWPIASGGLASVVDYMSIPDSGYQQSANGYRQIGV